MFNAKVLIMDTLTEDETLLTLLGGENIFNAYPDEVYTFPCVSFYEVDNVPGLVGDGQELASNVLMAVDVWVENGSTTDIVQRVNSLLQGVGFKRVLCQDMDKVDETSVIRRKIMQFEIKR